MLDFSKLVFNAKTPVYIQILTFVKRQIYLGNVHVGSELPSRRELSSILKINPNTSQKAFRAMEEEGILMTPKNSVSLVFFDEDILAKITKEFKEDFIFNFIFEAKENHFTQDEVLDLIKRKWGE